MAVLTAHFQCNRCADQQAGKIGEHPAAAYGLEFAKNHCFKDGNKRISLSAIDVFLRMNGHELMAQEAEAVIVIEALTAGDTSEDDLAHWIEANSAPLDK